MRDLSRRPSGRLNALTCGAMAALFLSSLPVTTEAQTPRWTWTLYDSSDPVVLALEIPDTPVLRTTLECQAGSGQVLISLYDEPRLAEGPAVLEAGSHKAAAEVRHRRDRRTTVVALDHPVFTAFQTSGQLDITSGDHTATIHVLGARTETLRRFAQACAS